MTDFAFYVYVVLPIVITSTFAAAMGYGGYRYILYKYPLPGDPGYPKEAPDMPARPAPERH